MTGKANLPKTARSARNDPAPSPARRTGRIDPFRQFGEWYEEARRTPLAFPNAMSLSTVRADGRPASRVVLLSSWDRRGFVFHTNRKSAKGLEIAACPSVALLFWWEPQNRQVRIEGEAEPTADPDSDAYFAARPRGSQLGAWASSQSRPVRSREDLEARFREAEARFGGVPVPRPPHWGGYRVVPVAFEFWAGREHRLHDRVRYDRAEGRWRAVRLFP